MSLFTVIKYPISEYPIYEELSALPKHVYRKWLKEANWPATNGSFATVEQVMSYYNYRKALRKSAQLIEQDMADVQLLRDIIKRMR